MLARCHEAAALLYVWVAVAALPSRGHQASLLPLTGPPCCLSFLKRRSTRTVARSAPQPTAAPSCCASTPQVGRLRGCPCQHVAARWQDAGAQHQAASGEMLQASACHLLKHTRPPPSAPSSPLPQAPCAARARWLPRRWRWSACGQPRRRSGAATSLPLRGHRRCGKGKTGLHASLPGTASLLRPVTTLTLPCLQAFLTLFPPLILLSMSCFLPVFLLPAPAHPHRCVSWS